MAVINRSALVMYSARAMFDLINDIESYPHFLPWCVGAKVHSRRSDLVEASLDVAKGGIRHSFTTRNLLSAGESIEMELVQGPFSKLKGKWHFKTLADNACKVELDLTFTLSGKVLEKTLGALLVSAASSMVDAFCQRAKEVYG
ncbi:type II toxin-antitoxin system RatA family toxin [Zooshikella ganghwensis]|uniref:Type II toxin-antitoxin system RatA family toxin n=1 Tax=Zooshikella ganghwensis TaxID=202772 RepID=A0A4P9VU38_9GAMM|nr:type II toxin-antitoxin system RatA family toxin [Zooshikella ganghwensis]RDH45802.1 type II toxin-antitoxin system RatA family toxin [Zooshikella ganghwensis]